MLSEMNVRLTTLLDAQLNLHKIRDKTPPAAGFLHIMSKYPVLKYEWYRLNYEYEANIEISITTLVTQMNLYIFDFRYFWWLLIESVFCHLGLFLSACIIDMDHSSQGKIFIT